MTLEELLNNLISKGWKPFGEERITKINRCEQYAGHWNWGCWSDKSSYWRWKCTRELVSKNSGLWQFVCKNDMADDGIGVGRQKVEINKKGNTKRKNLKSWKGREEYEYRLIESSLKDESELEEFLLSNIKIDG